MENILVDVQVNAAIITINRPKQLNALNKRTIEEINHALSTLSKNREVRGIIITGAGDKAFVAGDRLGATGTGTYAVISVA